MLIILSGCGGGVSLVKKKEMQEKKKKAIDNLRQRSECENTAETLGGWGIKFPHDCMDVHR